MLINPAASLALTSSTLCHVAGVNLIGAIRFEARQGGNVFVTIGSHGPIAVDVYVTFLVENPAAKVKFRQAKIRRVNLRQLGGPRDLAARYETFLYD
jgi:hypothetical protein